MTPDELPDFNKEEWAKMFGESINHYLWDEEEEEDRLPPPQFETIERRENRIITALEEHCPAIPLQVPDPPTTPRDTTPYRTPSQNRFEPLRSEERRVGKECRP